MAPKHADSLVLFGQAHCQEISNDMFLCFFYNYGMKLEHYFSENASL